MNPKLLIILDQAETPMHNLQLRYSQNSLILILIVLSVTLVIESDLNCYFRKDQLT